MLGVLRLSIEDFASAALGFASRDRAARGSYGCIRTPRRGARAGGPVAV
jgi:hypothetical protein